MTPSESFPPGSSPSNPENIQALILHEDRNILQELEEALQKIGFSRIFSMQNFEEAVWESGRSEISCFLCAYATPQIHGLRFLNLIRKNEKFISTPFFLTDPEFTSLKVMKAGQAGVSGLLVLPFTLKILHEKILRSLSQKEDSHIRHTQSQVLQGISSIDNGRYKEGIRKLQSVLDQKEGPEYHYNIGYIRSIQKRYPEAIEAFRKATQLDRLFAKAYEAMGRAYRAMGRDDLADQHLAHAARIHMERDNDGHAEDILKEMLSLGHASLNVFNSLGVIYRKRGDHRNAMLHYAKALKIHPEEPNIYYNMGRICLDMKEMERAREFFEKALQIQKDFKEARQVLKAMELGML